MTVKQILKKLEALGNESVCRLKARQGNFKSQYGVKTGDLRKLAKEIKTNHKLGMQLWETGNVDARLLAILVIKPKELSINELEAMIKDAQVVWLADWLNAYVVKKHPESEVQREKWMDAKHSWLARAGWNLTAATVSKAPKTLDLNALLNRIEKEMPEAVEATQWTMNNTLASIGIHHPDHRKQALAIGEKLGIYRDYPVAKGCTSPYAPIWINEMVSRQQPTKK